MPGRSIATSGVAKALTDTATSHSTHQLLPFLCPRLFPDDAAPAHPPPSRRRIRRLSSSSASPAALALQVEAAPVNKASMLSSLHQFSPSRNPAAMSEVDLRSSVMKKLQDIVKSSSIDPKGKATKPSPLVRRLKSVDDQIRTTVLRNDSAVVGELVKAFVALDQVMDGFDYIKEAATLGLSLDIDVFRAVARNLEANHLYHHIPLLFELSERVLGRTSFRMLEENTRALVKLRNYAALKPILKRYDAAGLKPRTGTYNRILQAHLQNCDVISAQNVLFHMRQSGVAMNGRTYAAALAGARRMGMTMAVRRILSMTRTAATTSTVTLNAALRYQAQENNLPATVEALKQFGMEGAPGTTHLVPPDGYTYSIIIHRLAQIGDLPKAIQAFAHATDHGIRPTYSMTAALIKAYVDNRDLLAAYRLLSEMCKGQAQRDAVFIDPLLQRFETVVANAAVAGRRKTAEVPCTQTEPEAMKLCDWKGMELRSLHFADLLDVVTRRMGAYGAVPILLLMRALNQPMTVRIFRILTSRIPPTNTARLATVLEPMIRDAKDPAVMQAATNFLLEKRQLRDLRRQRLARFSNSAILSGIRQAKAARSNSIASQAAITVSTKHHRVTAVANRLESVSDRLQSLGVGPDRNTYAIQMRQAAIIEGNTAKARNLLKTMIKAGLKPDIRHYSALIEGYALRGNMPAAKHMMREYERYLVPAKSVGSRFDGRYKSSSSGSSSIINLGLGNVVLWTLLIVGYGRINRPDQARLAMEEMIREGVVPDVHSVQALAKVHLAHNQSAKAKSALLDFWPTEAGPLTDELKKLDVRKLLKAMWKQGDKQERRVGGPPEWNGLTKKELMEVRSGLDKIAAAWKGEPVSSGPSARLLEELERLPKASRGPSEERLTPGTLPGRSNLVSKYPAKPWSERS